VNKGALETLAATRNELGAEDRASRLADVMRAARRASHIHDTRRADVEQEAQHRRACDSLLAIRHLWM